MIITFLVVLFVIAVVTVLVCCVGAVCSRAPWDDRFAGIGVIATIYCIAFLSVIHILAELSK